MSSRYARRIAAAALSAAVLAVALPLQAAVTPEQNEQAEAATRMLKEAGELALSGDFEAAKKLVIEVQETVKKIQGDGKDPAVNKLVAPLAAGLKARQRFLAAHGITVPGMEQPQAAMASTPGSPSPTPTPAPASGAVSFVNQIAPIFVQRCNNCHVTGTRGNFSMASYAAMMRGANGIEMVTPGKGADSRLIEVMETGDMPRGGGPLPKDQIALISKWIDEGAKFDGPDANAPLTGLVPRPNTPRLEVKTATGRESIKFSRDIAPVIASQCLDCHAGGQPSGQLGLDTFQRMLAGNQNSGPIITPGKGADSLLVKKLKGEAGQRMPLRKAPLSDETIAKFQKWIDEGATFDGGDPRMSVARVAAIYAAGQMTHEELAQARVQDAQRNWRLANPDVTPDQVETTNFLLMGNVGEDRLREIGDVAEKLVPRLAQMFKLPTDKPIVKGRITIFAVNRRFEYSEFGRMVERRELPDTQRGHFRFTITDAYACIYPPQTDSDGALEPLIAEQIAGVLVESHGEVPSWFSQGSAWEVAARIGPKDRRTVERDNYVTNAASKMTKADDFLTNKLPPLDASVMNYSFVKFLMGRNNANKYQQLLSALKGGAKFEPAFRSIYGGTPNQVAGNWGGSSR